MKTTMSLAKALKEKNRIAEKIQGLRSKIREYNSVDLGSKRPISIQDSLAQLQILEENLIRIKAAITTANSGSQGDQRDHGPPSCPDVLRDPGHF